MPTINELTEVQFKDLLNEYFATSEKRSKMDESEVRSLAQKLNEKINVPLVKETKEEKILIKVIVKVDTFLYDHLPNEFYDLVRSVDKGIDDEEAKRLIKRLTKLANEKIDIPWIPEPIEYIPIRFVISVIINSARKQWDMARAQEEVDVVPGDKDASDEAIEAMII